MGWRNSLEHRFSMQLALDEGNEMPKPEMKQESELTLADFLRHPIWIGVHNYDVDEPWYEESDEETVRPWTGSYRSRRLGGPHLLQRDFCWLTAVSTPDIVVQSLTIGTNRRCP